MHQENPLFTFPCFSCFFMLFLVKKVHSLKSTVLVTRNPLYFSCTFCAFLDIFLGEHWIFGPFLVLLVLFCSICGGFGPTFVLFGPFGLFSSFFGHFFCPFLSIW